MGTTEREKSFLTTQLSNCDTRCERHAHQPVEALARTPFGRDRVVHGCKHKQTGVDNVRMLAETPKTADGRCFVDPLRESFCFMVRERLEMSSVSLYAVSLGGADLTAWFVF